MKGESITRQLWQDYRQRTGDPMPLGRFRVLLRGEHLIRRYQLRQKELTSEDIEGMDLARSKTFGQE